MVVALSLWCGAGLAPAEAAESTVDALQLMTSVRAALPAEELRIAGELQARDRRGNIVRVSLVEMTVDWGAAVPQATYVILDRFGTEQERLQVRWPPAGTPEWTRYTDGVAEPVAAADSRVAGLDLYWTDLSLSFLWWPDAEWIGSERVRGRFCHVLELPAPEGDEGPYGRVRLWVDPEARLLLQADGFDRNGRHARRLQVTSLRKIDEIWMVQNLDLFNPSTRERVTLRVREVERLADLE